MLTQAEADELIATAKHFLCPPSYFSMPPGVDDTYQLAGPGNRERFLLDLWRGTIRLSKLRFQNRVRTAIVLVRLDVNGAPHTNPNGMTIPGTHIHLFKEGYDDKWAYPVNSSEFTSLNDLGTTFSEFCAFCNIEAPPPFQEVIV